MGGLTEFNFKNDKVILASLKISKNTLYNLEDRLLLFTGYSRSAGSILKTQDEKSLKKDTNIMENLNYIKKLGVQSKNALMQDDLNSFGEIMNEHWENKKQRSAG